MKANFLAVLALASFAAGCNGCAEVISCDDSVIRNGVQHYQQMLNDSSSSKRIGGNVYIVITFSSSSRRARLLSRDRPSRSNWLRHRGFQRISRKRRHHCRLGNMPGPTTWWLLVCYQPATGNEYAMSSIIMTLVYVQSVITLFPFLFNSWAVYWGDGTYSSQTATTLGPFQVTHQYSKSQNYYYVTVYYCSNPPYPLYRCCGVLYGTITTFQEDL